MTSHTYPEIENKQFTLQLKRLITPYAATANLLLDAIDGKLSGKEMEEKLKKIEGIAFRLSDGKVYKNGLLIAPAEPPLR